MSTPTSAVASRLQIAFYLSTWDLRPRLSPVAALRLKNAALQGRFGNVLTMAYDG
jgi:hypothetical protein